jgi:hypothetical protein
MVRVKMSLLTILLAEKERKRRNEEKKTLTLLPSSPALLRELSFFSLFFSLLYCMHGNDDRSKNTMI